MKELKNLEYATSNAFIPLVAAYSGNGTKAVTARYRLADAVTVSCNVSNDSYFGPQLRTLSEQLIDSMTVIVMRTPVEEFSEEDITRYMGNATVLYCHNTELVYIQEKHPTEKLNTYKILCEHGTLNIKEAVIENEKS